MTLIGDCCQASSDRNGELEFDLALDRQLLHFILSSIKLLIFFKSQFTKQIVLI